MSPGCYSPAYWLGDWASGLSTLPPRALALPTFVLAHYFPGYTLDSTVVGLPDSPAFPWCTPYCFDFFFWHLSLASNPVSGCLGFGDPTSWSSWTCSLGPNSTLWFCSHTLAQQVSFPICDWSLGHPAPDLFTAL